MIYVGLLTLILARKPESLIGHNLIYASAVGLTLAVAWLFFCIQGKRILENRWEEHLADYENTISNPEHRLFQKIKRQRKNWPSLEWSMENLNILAWLPPGICLIVWIAITLGALTG